ncbi:hypothetical protein [Niabella drilacis]|uniref:Uncharacterized protein n=1 Tax=Niabella drilacis (strain DSM 25811 / CCM 8410 / CCUG 62505 / LMG 26954 / E90) TaxID=1285928 RepID=A0A1G6JFU4_NIADE|nr:hypothetical protein [Niabella drilacis]SDC17599.1 hypothetical protein SAMN04487894_101524 [Niabella drilacis]
MRTICGNILSGTSLLMIGAFMSCSKDRGAGKPPIELKTVVYTAGWELGSNSKLIAKYWKNDEETLLSNGTADAAVYSLVVNGKDGYAAGFESVGAIAAAVYWKNDTAVRLTNGTKEAVATAVTMSNGDVYVAGHMRNADNRSVATYWNRSVVLLVLGLYYEVRYLCYTMLLLMQRSSLIIYLFIRARLYF